MKKSSLFKLTSLLLALVMMLTIVTGCGGTTPTSDVESEAEADGFVQKEQDIDSDLLENKDSTVSTAPNNSQSNSQGDNANSNSSDKQDTAENDVFKNIPAKLKGKTVIFADWGEAIADPYQKVLKKFTEETGIRYKMIQFLGTEYINKVAQQIAAGKAPDVVGTNSWFPASLEIVQELPSTFNVSDGFWDERITTALSVGNKKYFVNSLNSPFCTGSMVFYNKKLFNSAGIKTPQEYVDEGKWSWENLRQAAKDCVTAGYKGAIVEPMALAGQLGTTLVKYDPKKGTFTGNTTDSGFLSALQYYSKGIEEGMFYNGLYDELALGGVGMTVYGTWGLKAAGAFRDMLPNEIGVVPLPDSYEGKKLSLFPSELRGYGISKGSENAEAAYYLLRYYLDMDKHEPAGANMFANKALEKYYYEQHLVNYRKQNLSISYYANPLQAVDARWDSPNGMWKDVKHAPSGQVAVELEKMKNVLQNALEWANAKVDDFG